MTYDEARATLEDLNRRIRAVEDNMTRSGTPVEDYTAWLEARNELIREGRAAGFILIFNGSFKLDLKKINAAA